MPFYNYFQAAIVLGEDGWVAPTGVLRVASELVEQHRFDADALARSYLELVRRGHVKGSLLVGLEAALRELEGRLPTVAELERAVAVLSASGPVEANPGPIDPPLDYVELAGRHRGGKNRRRPGR